jgi:Glycosyl transferase family 2
MRQGVNPIKETDIAHLECAHRIIIPIYVPELSGYFERSIEILELCLDSLRASAAGKAAITIIANGCAAEALETLRRYYEEGWIDQLIENHSNRGKVDAMVAAARGCFEPLITFSDGDVLFRPGWLEQIERIFNAFPECGIASPTPLPALVWSYTANTVFTAWTRGELKFANVVPLQDMNRFAESINNPAYFRPVHHQEQLLVHRGGVEACVGCGHFICTIRREVVPHMPQVRCQKAVGGWSEAHWVDFPPDRMGLWRLSTTEAYAYHMGNMPEPWMFDELEKYKHAAATSFSDIKPTPPEAVTPLQARWTNRLPAGLRQRLMNLIRKLPAYKHYI